MEEVVMSEEEETPFRLFIHLSQSFERPEGDLSVEQEWPDDLPAPPLYKSQSTTSYDRVAYSELADDALRSSGSRARQRDDLGGGDGRTFLRRSQSMGSLIGGDGGGSNEQEEEEEEEEEQQQQQHAEPSLRDSGMTSPQDGARCFVVGRSNSRQSLSREGSGSKLLLPRRASKGSLSAFVAAESCGPVLDEFSIPFMNSLLRFASSDLTLGDDQLEDIVQSVAYVLMRRALMHHFVPHLVHLEYHGDLNTWRERTGLMLLHSVAADCPTSFTFLTRSSKSFLAQVTKACTPRQLVSALTDLFVKLQKQMHTLPALQTYILQCVYSETDENAFGLAMIFFLRFVLPYLTHPRHAVNRPTIISATKMISFIAGSQVADYETWSDEQRALCTTWRARVVSLEFFRGVLDRKVATITFQPKEQGARRRTLDEVRSTLLPYAQTVLPKLGEMGENYGRMAELLKVKL